MGAVAKNGIIEKNLLGVNIREEGYDISTLDNNVCLIDYETQFDSTTLPIPEAAPIMEGIKELSSPIENQ
jgi:hypothetical protein